MKINKNIKKVMINIYSIGKLIRTLIKRINKMMNKMTINKMMMNKK